ncbi:MAG TPA: hypothetical protein VHD32_14730 [Candidatus Didemnitutus sp.]|nr:hypothetical protein [Candidatus Didemnitutus sp.]
MPRRLVVLPVIFLLVVLRLAAGTDGWATLKRGMSQADTYAVLGKPLIRTAGRGFEVWIYDHNAEVLFFRGPVIAWTAPDSKPGAATDNDHFEWPALWTPPAPRARPRISFELPASQYLPSSSFMYGNH